MELTPTRLAIPNFDKVFNGRTNEKPLVDISSGRYTSSDNDSILEQD